MPELKKIETQENVSNYLPQDGYVTQFFAEDESGNIALNLKLPDGTIQTLSGGGGDAVYYKCASVDTASKTWTGYKAVLTDGVYSFEETVTEGLTYGNSFTPSVNVIYNQDATVRVQKLFNGVDETLVFHAWLDAEAATAETGQAMTASGNVQYTTVNGRDCAYFDSARLTVDDISKLPVNGSNMTVAGWFNFAYIYDFNFLFGYGDECVIRAYENKVQFVYNSGGFRYISSPIESNVWYHVAGTWNGSVATLYVNGVSVNTSTSAVNFDASRPLTIGASDRSGNGKGYVSDIRIYNRCLTAEEIAELANA